MIHLTQETAEDYIDEIRSNNGKLSFEIKNNEIYFENDGVFWFNNGEKLTLEKLKWTIHCGQFDFKNNSFNNEIFTRLKTLQTEIEVGEHITKKMKVPGVISLKNMNLTDIQIPYRTTIMIDDCKSSNNLAVLKTAKGAVMIYDSEFDDLSNINNEVTFVQLANMKREHVIGKLPKKIKQISFYNMSESPSDILRVFLYPNIVVDAGNADHKAIKLIQSCMESDHDIYSAASTLIEAGFEKYAAV